MERDLHAQAKEHQKKCDEQMAREREAMAAEIAGVHPRLEERGGGGGSELPTQCSNSDGSGSGVAVVTGGVAARVTGVFGRQRSAA